MEICRGFTGKDYIKYLVVFFAITFVGVLLHNNFVFYVKADLQSSNYKLIDPQVGTSGNTLTSSSGNYRLLTQFGTNTETKQISSSLYSLGSGHGYTFMANVPTIRCFETVTDGTSNCNELPSGTGMVQICGESGCYDRARFEIDPQNNPSNTKYAVYVTDDNWSTIYYVDGTTHMLETASTHNFSDYKTLQEWQVLDGTTDWSEANLLGLEPNKTYKIRASAIRGWFTESRVGPEASATTTSPVLVMDLDIGVTSNVESSPPYSLKFPVPVLGSVETTTNNLYMDLSTNAVSGVKVQIKDAYAGLQKDSGGYVINSLSDDLAKTSITEGYGFKVLSLTEDSGPGVIRAVSKFMPAQTEGVGKLNTTFEDIFCSKKTSGTNCSSTDNAPVLNARISSVLKFKISANTPMGNYNDKITFQAFAQW